MQGSPVNICNACLLGRQWDEVAKILNVHSCRGRRDSSRRRLRQQERREHCNGQRYLVCGSRHYRRSVHHPHCHRHWWHHQQHRGQLAALPVHHHHRFRNHRHYFHSRGLPHRRQSRYYLQPTNHWHRDLHCPR